MTIKVIKIKPRFSQTQIVFKKKRKRKKKDETTILVPQVHSMCVIDPSNLKRAQLVP